MRSKLKIIIGSIITFLFVIALNYILKENVIILSGLLIFITLFFFLLHGKKTFWNLGKFWLKFALLLISVITLFGIIKCRSVEFECISPSLFDGINTALILINTVYALQLFILSISINDILSLRISIRYLKLFILARTLMTQIVAKFENDKILFNIIPEFQLSTKSKIKSFKPLFLQNIIHIITITFYLVEQGDIIGKLIDNRINHLHKSKTDENN